ncbi:MAG TPA: sigma-70 family RNA polymerase sigma factor [Candidatus Acidoferrum sp.]|nr:sigma-70 family RNA polymerase sigma factor [Candidatus Acidoferrum sp.]
MRESIPREAPCETPLEAICPIQQCNPEAFERVYEANSKLVRRLCLRMLRDPIEAEDAAQDVFVCVLLKLHTFRGESALSSWLYRLTTNLVLMRFRRNNHNRVFQREFLAGNGELLADIGMPDFYLNGVVDRVDLQAALDQLPDGYREVFVLHDVQGFAHKEIAKRFGYSVGNSKSQLHKARKRLRELLGAKPSKGPPRETTKTHLLAVAPNAETANHPISGY